MHIVALLLLLPPLLVAMHAAAESGLSPAATPLDVTVASIFLPAAEESIGGTAADFLVEELNRRGLRAWTRSQLALNSSASAPVAVLLLLASEPLRGLRPHDGPSKCTQALQGLSEAAFAICASPPLSEPLLTDSATITLAANSRSALVQAAGRLLRELNITLPSGSAPALATIPAHFHAVIDPPSWAAMRWHQLTDWGFYMPDAVFEQHVRELITFGCNGIEFAHMVYSGIDDNGVSRADAAVVVRFSAIAAKYGVSVSFQGGDDIWPSNYTEWVFAHAPRIDSIFFEGVPLQLLQAAVAAARQYHPNVVGWHSPCGDNRTGWLSQLADPSTHQWLQGVVWGPITLGGEMQELQMIKGFGYEVQLFCCCSTCCVYRLQLVHVTPCRCASTLMYPTL
jgi:hypothetical protein